MIVSLPAITGCPSQGEGQSNEAGPAMPRSPKSLEWGPKLGMVPPDESHFAVGTVGIVSVIGVLSVLCFVLCHIMSFILALLVVAHIVD